MDAPAILATAVKRVVENFHPLRVFVFGSRAWGTPDDDSDFDLLVVMPDDADTAQLAADIRWSLRDLRAAFDIVVRRRQAWQKWSNVPVTLEHRIAKFGKMVHDAAA